MTGYGKIFESMFTGSMRGCGALAFAVWSYVIAHQKPVGKERETFEVEINSEIVGFLLGERAEDVGKTIEGFCEPDPHSRSEEKEGRKLVKTGQYTYEVVNGAKYDRMRRECDRREATRVRVSRWRKKKGKPLPGQVSYEKAVKNGASQEELDRITDNSLRGRAEEEGFEHYNSQTSDEADGVK